MRRHKYKVASPERRTWNGKTYASRAEMMHARTLSLERDAPAGSVLDFVEQPRVWLGVRENVYVPDFLVLPREGEPWFVDVKGVETAAFKRNKKLWRKYARLPLHVVAVDSSGVSSTTEVIMPED